MLTNKGFHNATVYWENTKQLDLWHLLLQVDRSSILFIYLLKTSYFVFWPGFVKQTLLYYSVLSWLDCFPMIL